MNYLRECEGLANRYYVMRHGHSQANAQGIIVSQPRNGLDQYGLTGQGVDQVRSALQQATNLGADTQVISSDFRRARETAAIAHAELGCHAPLRFDPRLRERDFGTLELSSSDNYERVWAEDAIDDRRGYAGSESASQVMHRVTALVLDCESEYANASILFVSHGDALQILQTAFLQRNAAAHRGLQHLQTAEIRSLELNIQ